MVYKLMNQNLQKRPPVFIHKTPSEKYKEACKLLERIRQVTRYDNLSKDQMDETLATVFNLTQNFLKDRGDL